jgi:cytochrome c biogenesis protein CcmG/thiol:disulfide interchange protein DsbE
MPSTLLDRPVPAFSLSILGNENEIIDEKIFKGEPSLLNVWATWCFSCRIEHPFLHQLSLQGIRIIGLNYKDNTLKAKNWLDEKKDPYILSLVDQKGIFAMDLGVFGAPETYMIDSRGIIRHKHVGIIDDFVWNESLMPIWKSLK